ncbi:glycogen debranching N-terminal domain-containing protein [Micromonospora sp. 4G55]|uniref:amylo-alpha-1,6-glucosidase n=1 Tax=Micromonospora sp. 4G55 TaxID=2806102 RepID=UPI001A5BB308|nr:glycogen debranching N-terminal domain-containing protein [Micromonospora sp. 4G55]MBM0256630.1 hypothetical protein [Micromonospora sp. 4G55]
MKTDLVRILDGNIFVLSDGSGDLEAKPTVPCGFYSYDTRFLSLWRLTLNGERLSPLARDDPSYFEVRFFLVPGEPTHYVDAKVSVIRERSVAGSFEEQLTVLNHSREPAEITVHVEADSDFMPLIVAAQGRTPKGRLYRRVENGRLHLGYQRDAFRRETVISSTTEPAQVDERGLTYQIRIEPHGQWTTTLHVRGLVLRPDGEDVREHLHPGRRRRDRFRLERNLQQWLGTAPQLNCDWEPLERTYRQCLVDLAALGYSPLTLPAEALPAAGLPWSATLAGREPIFASLQALPFAPDLARAALHMLGIDQGAVLDDFRDEEPGKILREFRYGELVAFEERPQAPYYGAADVTPLYVVLLDEYERWTGDADTVREFEDEARAALHWIDEYGDIMGDGYVWYQRRNEQTGLENQCWKESRGFLWSLGVAPAAIPAELHAQAGLYRSILAERRMLILLDNCRDWDQIRHLLPGTGGSLVIATSRRRITGVAGQAGAHPLHLDLLTHAEARELLTRRLGDEAAADPAAVDEIIARCGRLPLALALVATRSVGRPGLSLPAVAGELAEADGRLAGFGDTHADLEAIFSWSYRALTPEQPGSSGCCPCTRAGS